MAIEIIKKFTCDICGNECGERDGHISIRVNSGDGRDVGPASIEGKLTFYQPYGAVDGLVCRECKKKWLTRYVETLG